MSTREEWLTAASQLIYDIIISPIAVVKSGEKWAVSCGWPSRQATSGHRRRVGECWSAESCADLSTRHVFISPLLTEAVDGAGYGVLPTLAHELVHVVAGTAAGHRGEFRRVALAIGLTGKMTETLAGSELCEKLAAIAKQLGPYPHVAIVKVANARKQGTRMIKCVAVDCTQCDYAVRTTRIWLSDFGPPRCPHGSPMQPEGVDIFGNDTK